MDKFAVTLCSLAVLAATAALARKSQGSRWPPPNGPRPMDMANVAAELQAGGKMPVGANVDAHRLLRVNATANARRRELPEAGLIHCNGLTAKHRSIHADRETIS